MLFNNTIENIGRIRKIVEVLAKYGFEDIVVNTGLRNILTPKKKAKGRISKEEQQFTHSRWERIRLIMEELGPTYIKLGQMLSNRPDFVPEPLIKELEKLLDDVPPFSTEKAREIIEKELSQPISEIFMYFDEKPIGSASIGQVHRARLTNGDDVVVKVQRPNAKRQVTADLALIREFVKLTENYFIKAGILNPLEIVDTFSKSLQSELDYSIEARNLDQFRSLYRDDDTLYIPKPFRDLTTKKVLTSEFISGCKVNDIPTLKSWGLRPPDIARKGLNIYLKQIFEVGIFHADPHPGNILIKPNGKIGLIDFGMVGKLVQSQKYAFAGVFISLANKDAKSMATNLRRLAIDHEINDMRAFEYDLNDLIQDYVVLANEDVGVKDFTVRLQKLAYKYKLQIPGVIFLILRSLSILEGTAKTLDPKFDILENIKPYGIKLIAEQYSLKNISGELSHTISQAFSLLYNLPLEMRDIVKQIRKGKIVLNTRQIGFEKYQRQLDFMANRLVMAIIIGALIIASALSYGSALEKDVAGLFGVPYFSIFCLLVAGFLGFVIFINDYRSGRNRHQ
ncbi:MAG: AarF/ABC1/UbiB kinase family protein [Cyclobacteriaceae bacterium]|nr:AarF/ABC1/UbiB kinase family protein [Cyclobacteriaceae bacterium]